MRGAIAARRKVLAGLVVVVALAVPALLQTGGAAAAARPIYFWANLGNVISSPVHTIPNPPVIRPSTLLIFEDGQWLIEKLHWTGWGSPVAKATGKSSSSDDKPNAEEGKRIITWAKVTLYKPGVFEGKRVYRCIRIQVPPPAEFGTRCLERTGKSVGLGTPGFGTPVGGGEEGGGGARHLGEFFSPGRKVWCQINSSDGGASCGSYPEPPTHSAWLKPNGRVEICSVEKLEYPGGPGHPPLGCYQNWPANPLPILRVGETTALAGIRCASAADGITCTRGTGRGFRVNADEAVEVPAGSN